METWHSRLHEEKKVSSTVYCFFGLTVDSRLYLFTVFGNPVVVAERSSSVFASLQRFDFLFAQRLIDATDPS